MKGSVSVEWLYILLMQRGAPTNNSVTRWDNYEGMPISGSLIVPQTSNSSKNYNHPVKSKYDDFGFKQNQLVRHDSEKLFTKS
jgi:hypothetical protein